MDGLDLTFPAVASSVVDARISVTRWLYAARGDKLMIGDVAVAVSEACTNVVMHAYPDAEPGSFGVCAERDGEDVLVTVTDGGYGVAPRPDSPGVGLGLPLMAALTDAFEVSNPPDGSGTVIFMRFSPEGARTRTA